VKQLSSLVVINKIENVLQSLNAYFGSSPKRHLEFQKLAKLLHTKELKMIKQVKTRWLSMLSPLQRVMSEYRTIVAKLAEDNQDPEQSNMQQSAAKQQRALVLDIIVPVALSCFLPLLHTMNCLVKFSQQRDIFICDYMAAVRVCQAELYELYSNPATNFQGPTFSDFNDFLACKHGTMSTV
jgi:hypothetical protein